MSYPPQNDLFLSSTSYTREETSIRLSMPTEYSSPKDTRPQAKLYAVSKTKNEKLLVFHLFSASVPRQQQHSAEDNVVGRVVAHLHEVFQPLVGAEVPQDAHSTSQIRTSMSISSVISRRRRSCQWSCSRSRRRDVRKMPGR
jgi:hypothetical protein